MEAWDMNANRIREINAHDVILPDKVPGDDPPRIVIAEDDEEMVDLLTHAFEKAGYEVSACRDGWEILKLLGIIPSDEEVKDVALVVSDIRLPGISGLEALKTCGYSGRFPPIILITAFGDEWTYEEARRLGAVAILDKPFVIDDLVEKVQQLVPLPR
jgi:DNA-binding response OmpR family regulator